MREMTPDERERLIRSVISSQALSGIHVTYEEAKRAFDQVMQEPLVELNFGHVAEPCCKTPDKSDCSCTTDRSRS